MGYDTRAYSFSLGCPCFTSPPPPPLLPPPHVLLSHAVIVALVGADGCNFARGDDAGSASRKVASTESADRSQSSGLAGVF